MIISYHGHEFFRIQFGDIVIATNPPHASSPHAGPHFGADIVLVSLNHKDFNAAESLSHGSRSPFVVIGPGEYEIKDVVIRGFGSTTEYSGKKYSNTIYTLSLEGMQLGFLGPIQTTVLPAEAKEAFDAIDILFVPIGGGDVLSAKDAYKLALGVEPKRIIPMHGGSKSDGALAVFLKEAGEDKKNQEEKLTIKKKDLLLDEGTVVVLKPV